MAINREKTLNAVKKHEKERILSVSSVDEDYIDSYVKDFSNYASSVQSDYDKVSYSNADSYYTKYGQTSDDLNRRANAINYYLDAHKDEIDPVKYNELSSYLKQSQSAISTTRKSFKEAKDYYSQFETEEDYNKYKKGVEERERMLSFDLEAGKNDIDSLESQLDKLKKEKTAYDTEYKKNGGYVPSTSNYNRPSQSQVDSYKEWSAKSGAFQKEIDALEKELAEKRVYYNRSERTQTADNLYNTALGSEDFGTISLKGKDNEIAQKRDEYETKYGESFGDDYEFGEATLSLKDRFAKYATDEEMNIYSYYLGKGDETSAQAFLMSMEETINARKGLGMYESVEDNTALEMAFGAAAGVQQFGVGIGNLFTDKDYYTPTATQMASSAVREDLGDVGPELPEFMGGGSLGQAGYDIINTTANMMPSILASSLVTYGTGGIATPAVASALGSAVGSVSLGASAAGNAYAEMINLGYDKGQARTYAALVGGSEAGLQYLFGGIGKLGGKFTNKGIDVVVNNIDNAFAKSAIKFGGNMVKEGFEEYAQEILDPFFKNIAFNESNEINLFTPEALYSGVLGALSAGFLEGVPGAVNAGTNALKTYQTGKSLTKNKDFDVSRLVELGNTLSADSVAYQIADKVNENTGAYTIGKLFHSIGAELSVQNKADIVKSLTRKGIAESNANTIAEWLSAVVDGAKLTKTQIKALELNEDIANTFRDVVINKNSTFNQRRQAFFEAGGIDGYTGVNTQAVSDYNTPDAVAGRMESRLADSQSVLGSKSAPSLSDFDMQLSQLAHSTASGDEPGVAPVGVKNSPFIPLAKQTASIKGTEKIKALEGVVAKEYDVSSDEGKTILKDTNEVVDIKKIASIDGKSMKLELGDGRIVSSKDVSYGTQGEALIYETVVNMGVPVDVANSLVSMYDPTSGQSAVVFAKGIEEAYKYGYFSIPKAEMETRTSFTSDLTAKQKEDAYKLGSIMGAERAKNSPETAGKRGAVGKGKVRFEGSRKGLSQRQKASLDALEVISEATGLQIEVFESKLVNGKRVGENGSYDPKTGVMRIDLHAGIRGEGLMLFTAAHELTHHIKNWSPAKFKVLADFLMEQYGERGVSVDALVKRQIAKAKANGRTLTYEEAYEEVIADSMESMLADGAVIEKLKLLATKDKSLVQKIKSFLKDLVAKIKKAYSGLKPDSAEGKLVAEMVDATEELHNLFVEALMDATENYKSAESDFVSIDNASESASPKLSERTWTASDYVVEREATAKMLANALGVTKKKALAYIDNVNSIAKMIADDRTKLDYEASPFGSAFVSNSEYGGSFDFTTLCKKRRLYTGTFSEIQKRLGDVALTPDDILAIRNMLIEKHKEATCGLCYVEGSRANMGKFAKEFIRLYKRDNPDAWIPSMYDVNTPDGVESMKINHPEAYEQYEYFWNHYGKLQPTDKALFASQQKPKLYESRKEYKGEILHNFSKDSTVAKKNLNGGIRMQSFSDFEIVHLIDTMQIIMDMASVGLAGQAYTKVPEFADAFGNTGLKINLSLIAKGVDADGNLIFDDREGMPHETAFGLRNKYSSNVGTIIVVFTDEQLYAAMADSRIDFIIPFHRSQWKKGQYGAMGLPQGTKDYTYMQNEKLIKQTYHEYRGKMVKDKASNYMPNEYWDFSKSGKENAEAYLAMCAENNKRPKFYKLLDYDGKGTYSLKKDGSTDGYWKLLIDFKMYDNNGVGSPQQAVTPTFSMDEAIEMLNEYKGGHQSYPVAYDVVDSFVDSYGNTADGRKFSDRDSEATKNPTSNLDVRYCDRDNTPNSFNTEGKTLTEQLNEAYEAAESFDQRYVYVGRFSNAFRELLKGKNVIVNDYPIAMNYRDAYLSMHSKDTGKYHGDGINYHDLGVNGLESALTSFESPKAIMMSKKQGKIELILQGTDKKGRTLLSIIAINTVTQNNRKFLNAHIVTSVYGRKSIEKYIRNAENEGRLLLAKKEETSQGIPQVQYEGNINEISSKDSISDSTSKSQEKLSDRDADYMSAVESGDMETAQRMVDEAAKKAFPNSILIQDGIFHKMWHHTTKSFTEFLTGTSPSSGRLKGIFFTPQEHNTMSNLGNIHKQYYLNVENVRFAFGVKEHASDVERLRELQKGVTDRNKLAEINRKFKEETGIDAFFDWQNGWYNILTPEQIKSADPVTYDDDGNVIPLSKRFDSSESDIRYSDREISFGRLTQERIDDIIADSGAGKRVDYARAWITNISPSDFIDLTLPYESRIEGRDTFDEKVQGDHGNTMSERDYIADLKNSRSMPRLSIDIDTGKVIGHDGRHRMRALEKAGASRTPVEIVFYKDGSLYKGNNDGVRLKAINIKRLTSQFDDVSYRQTHAYIHDVIPLNEDHRADIEREFRVRAVDEKYLGGIAYSDRDPDSTSPRNLLVNALEGTVQNDVERKKLAEYKNKIDLMNAEEEKLTELRKQIKEASFSKGKRDSVKLKQLKEDATKTANRINTYDRQLLNLESTQALKNVLEREKKKATERQKQKDREILADYKNKAEQKQQAIIDRYQESRKKATEGRHKTEMRNKIKKVVSELNQYLLHGTKDKHVMIGMQKAVAEALSIVNMDTVGADDRVARYDALIAEATDPDVIESLTASRDRIKGQGDRLSEKLTSLKSAYSEIVNSFDPLIANAYDDVIEAKIASVAETVGDTPLRDMSMSQLESVYDLYKMVLTNIRNANKLFKAEKQATIEEIGIDVDGEIKEVTKQKDRMLPIMDFARKMGYKELKPIYFFRMLGSKTMTSLYESVRDGQNTWYRDAFDAKTFRLKTEKEYGYKKWDFKKKHTFEAKSGKTFDLTLSQIMSIYAFSRREQALDHLIKGGIVYDDAVKVKEKKKGIPISYMVNTSDAFNLSEVTLGEIIDTLSPEQKAFVETMQTYLSDTMGEKGNEVSLELYGVKMFKEKNYFPLKSSQYYMAFTAEEAGEVRIKNSSFSKETVKHANNPIVLSDFMDVWTSHVNDMAMYHAFVLPLEDFTRVYNYRTPTGDNFETTSIKSTIHNHFTESANEYIRQLLKDINGGSVSGVGTQLIDKMIGLAKKGAVFASASVVVQQPSAIARAMAYVNPKYFANFSAFNFAKHNRLWEECKRYAPIAGIKEMGYFDTSVGQTGIEWIKSDEYETRREKFFAFLKDGEQRGTILDDILSKAPAMADELSWVALWEAVKKETKKTTDLKVGSEEYFEHCGKRFTEVIDLTQVYDSVFSRSELMRSKDRMVKTATAFLSEPTTQVNMLFDAGLHFKRNGIKGVGVATSVVSSVVASVVLNSLLKSFVLAGRDDDDNETFLEKYIASFTGDVLNGLNPMTLIPFVKDVISIFQGYSVDRMDMSVIDTLVSSVLDFGKDTKTDYEKWTGLLGSVSQLFGIPVKNIIRDINTSVNIYNTLTNGNETTKTGIKTSVEEGLSGTVTALLTDKLAGVGFDTSKGKQYYDAVMSGDTAHASRIIAGYGDAKKADSAIVESLKNYEPRVVKAAQAQINGDSATRIRLAKEIIADGFKQDYVVKAINGMVNKLNKGEAEAYNPKTQSLYTKEDYFDAAYNGNTSVANTYKEEILRVDMENNSKTREEAEKSFNNSFRSSVKDAVLAGELNAEKASNMLSIFGGLDEESALQNAQYYEFKRKHPGVKYNWQSETVADYYETAEPNGIDADVYDDYLVQKSECTGTDNNGDGKTDSGSKKAQVLSVIDSLPISSYQKDVLYRMNGWAESKLYEAPWH